MEPISRDTRPAYHSADRGQLIIGIDFGTHDSGVAFAIFSKTDAKEDIITEWPGSSKQYRPRVGYDAAKSDCLLLTYIRFQAFCIMTRRKRL